MRRSQKFVVVGVIVAVVTAAGIAFAAWTASGTGSGSAKATSAQGLVVTAGTASGDLYPGGVGNVQLHVQNPNPYAVTITDVTGNGAITSDNATCTPNSGVTFTAQHGLSQGVPANSSANITLTGAAAMATTSDNACQGATFTIPVSVSAHS
jgi:hypothetical protein